MLRSQKTKYISWINFYNSYVEKCANIDPCGLNTDLQPTNTTIEIGCATGVTWLEIENI